MPFPIRSIQVDGGNEFRAQFEQACQRDDIPQKARRPERPQSNGCVERHSDTARVEFRSQCAGELTVEAATGPLADCNHLFNHVRPHRRLDMMPPVECLAAKAA